VIHIAIGTKAQFIKMAPIMRLLQEKNIPFNFIDLGQHSLITADLRGEFGIKEPDVFLSRGANISHLSQGLSWMLKIFWRGLSSKWARENVFQGKEGVCLIHGDTVSTLLALYLAKRARVKTAHIEGGLRSFHFWEPFPEEMLRIWVMRLSDMIFAPSAWALENLKKMGLEKKSVLISANTSLESTLYSLGKKADTGLPLDKYCLVTVHRMENIFSRERMEGLLRIMARISGRIGVVFVQHQPTLNQLDKLGLQKKLSGIKNIHYFKILSHGHFISLLNGCDFVVTDGGSIQEEAYYLDKPCLLLRRFTERPEGLGENVVISGFSDAKIDDFLVDYKKFKRKNALALRKPSQEILDRLGAD
jgi:UDP-N-acetylglucosamine 2-epimerase (non-hydrolysing)